MLKELSELLGVTGAEVGRLVEEESESRVLVVNGRLSLVETGAPLEVEVTKVKMSDEEGKLEIVDDVKVLDGNIEVDT